jgi:hypothetical protein
LRFEAKVYIRLLLKFAGIPEAQVDKKLDYPASRTSCDLMMMMMMMT